MKKVILVTTAMAVLSGCSTFPDEVYRGERDCGYIGCETGGLVHYPHTPFYKHPCDFGLEDSTAANTMAEYHERRAREIACLKQHGLDPMGRALYQN